MRNTLLTLALVLGLFACKSNGIADLNAVKTFCNPVDMSYRFCLDAPSRREAADPTMIRFKGKFYLFPSKSGGYFSSDDLTRWDFIETSQIPTEEYAPTVVAIGDTLYFLASSETKSTIYKSIDVEKGLWKVALDKLEQPVWDPAFFLDDDGKLYLYWGCSNVKPTYGVEVDYKNNFKFVGSVQTFVKSDISKHGWEVPGDYNTIDSRSPWIEGSWVSKVRGKYYLQYAGPGTEFKSYCDGVYVSDKPLGPFTLQTSNPFCYKPEGFVAGGGHGSSLDDAFGNRWQIGCVSISKKHMFERRLAIFPVTCDNDGVLYATTKYGDYPTIVPSKKVENPTDLFTGWMLLSYNKNVKVSSETDTCPSRFMTDEDIRTYWKTTSGKAGENAVLDLGDACDVYAVQLNFAEDNTHVFGRQKGICHQYTLESSTDGKNWQMLVDKSKNTTDNSHPYMQLSKVSSCRYLRLTNVRVPDGNFAVSGFRVFGKGSGEKPGVIKEFTASRLADKRKVKLSWTPAEGADGYVVSYGISKDKMYQSYMIYGKQEVTINTLNVDQPYVFTIEAFNGSGITKSTLAQSIQ